MSNNTAKYTAQPIDLSILSVLNVDLDGKVVTADAWKTLWTTVFKHINSLDQYCVSMEEIRLNWEKSETALKAIVEDINKKYAVLKQSFIHYGSQEPTNEDQLLWVQPTAEVPESLLFTPTTFKMWFPVQILESNTLVVDMTKAAALSNASKYTTESFLAMKDIENITLSYAGGSTSITKEMGGWVIPKGTVISIAYNKGSVVSGNYYDCVATINVSGCWLEPPASYVYGGKVVVNRGYLEARAALDTTGILQPQTSVTTTFHPTTATSRLASVTLYASKWSGAESPYSQTVSIAKATKYSKVDLNPTVEQLSIFHNKDITFVTGNSGGTITVYCIGQKPTNDYTMQATITEVV